jgi:hypothetical protein
VPELADKDTVERRVTIVKLPGEDSYGDFSSRVVQLEHARCIRFIVGDKSDGCAFGKS